MYHGRMYNRKLIQAIKNRNKISERDLASRSGVSRGTLRAVLRGSNGVSIGNLDSIFTTLGIKTSDYSLPLKNAPSEFSTAVVSFQVASDQLWKVHYFNLVDTFRATLDMSLLVLPPVTHTPLRLKALLASIVCSLANEVDQVAPDWARNPYFLDDPWFVSGIENLKASAIQESPVWFRRNNIFVLSNFMNRV